MIHLGDTVSVPWGLDEFPGTLVRTRTTRQGQELGCFAVPELEEDLGPGEIQVPLDAVQLLPCKPLGWWILHPRR